MSTPPTTAHLLVELFVEELPPKALKKLGEAFAGVLAEQLKVQGLLQGDSLVTPYASPTDSAAASATAGSDESRTRSGESP